jgi:hypothetical protein
MRRSTSGTPIRVLAVHGGDASARARLVRGGVVSAPVSASAPSALAPDEQPSAFEQSLVAVGFSVSAARRPAPYQAWEALVRDNARRVSATGGGATRDAAVTAAHAGCVRPSPYADMLRAAEGRVAGETSRRAA